MKKEWDKMCGADYTPAAVTKKPKIHGVTESGETHPPMGGRGGQRGIGGGDPYVEDREVGSDLWGGILVFLASGIP